MTHVAIIVDWSGPYMSISEAKAAARDYEDGLYMAIGKKKYQKKPRQLQYVGIADELSSRVHTAHPKLPYLPELELWLGEIASTGIPGPKKKKVDPCLDLAEWALAYFLELPLNDRKRHHPPPRPVTVLNRWWYPDHETKRSRRPHSDWPDLVEYFGLEQGARTSWISRESSQIWDPEDF